MNIITSYTDAALSLLPSRPKRSNKGTFGRVLVVGGSYGMSGAAYFSAKAALRGGAGLVEILTPECNRVIYQTQLPEAVLSLYDTANINTQQIKNETARASAVVLGVGLGTSVASLTVTSKVLETVNMSLIIDADALNLLAAEPELWTLVPRGAIVTPHPMEMSRMTGVPVGEILADIPSVAVEFAKKHDVVCLLKDAQTAICDGERLVINHSGNSGMATGGSGDVLTGIIAALLAQGMKPFDAAALGAYIHGRAGDFAAARLSEYCVTASDIIDGLPQVFSLANNNTFLASP